MKAAYSKQLTADSSLKVIEMCDFVMDDGKSV
jgi:hypothetical protein